jgi:hypothetical protein
VTTFFKLATLAFVTIKSQVGNSLKAYTNLTPTSAHQIAICAEEVALPNKNHASNNATTPREAISQR